MEPIRLSDYRQVVILTGAGASVASGLRTFRGPGGLWNDEKVAELSQADTFALRPQDVWEFWGGRRAGLAQAQPSEVHHHLARVQRDLPETTRFTLVTQNVDGLHVRAGSRDVLEIHGRLTRTRCTEPSCALEPIEDDFSYEGAVPRCPECSSVLRPDIVLFGEELTLDAHHATVALRDVDLFVAIGTSGTVYPAAGYVLSATYAGARTVYINVEPMESDKSPFQEQYIGPAEEIVPQLLVV